MVVPATLVQESFYQLTDISSFRHDTISFGSSSFCLSFRYAEGQGDGGKKSEQVYRHYPLFPSEYSARGLTSESMEFHHL